MEDYHKNENQEYYGYVYITLDQKHNKIYVGQKKGKPTDKRNINYFGSGKIIQSKIKSRGTFFLKNTILGVCNSKKELNNAEKECIYFFKSNNFLYGYNIAKGGEGGDLRSGKSNSKNSSQLPLPKGRGLKSDL